VKSLASEAQRPHLVNLFGEVWQRLEGSRSALYQNEDPERDGQFSTIAVLETKDPARFLSDMASLATFVNASELLSRGEEEIDAKTIGELIVQLGDDSYAVRQTATTKLGLLGPAALPELERAAKSNDPETKFRAVAIRDQILAGEAQQREDLVKNDLLSRIKPQFAWFPKKEIRDGRAIDIVQMLLVDDDAQYSGPLRRLLGPEWDKIRLATVGKRVVVLLGSNTAPLDQAIADLEMPDKGLTTDPLLATFRDRAGNDQTAELHLSLGQTQRLLAPAAPADDKASEPAMTSVGVRIKPDRVRLEFFAPYSEAKAVVGHLGW
jgi:hypothetical protein